MSRPSKSQPSQAARPDFHCCGESSCREEASAPTWVPVLLAAAEGRTALFMADLYYGLARSWPQAGADLKMAASQELNHRLNHILSPNHPGMGVMDDEKILHIF